MRILIAEDDPALVRAADAALYKAKENGRNRVEVASDDVMLNVGF